MAKVRFVFGATDFTLNVSISYPGRRPINKRQVLDRTAAGTLRVEDFGVTVRTIPLNFVDITQTDYDNLIDFYDNKVDGALYPFTFYDEDGAENTVRFVTQEFDLQENSLNRYSGQATLEIVA